MARSGRKNAGLDDEKAAISPSASDQGPSFRGNHQHSVDDKNRLSVPAEYRALLQEAGETSVVLTNFICDGARCLEGFARSEWIRFETKLRQRSRFDPKLKKLENFYLSRATECAIDGNGRISLPSYLKTYAGLEKEVVFTSALHGFRIWDRRVWELVFQEAEAALLEDPSLFQDVDLS
jgi:MraZ protein